MRILVLASVSNTANQSVSKKHNISPCIFKFGGSFVARPVHNENLKPQKKKKKVCNVQTS